MSLTSCRDPTRNPIPEVDDNRTRAWRLARALSARLLRAVIWLWLLHLVTWLLFDMLPSAEFGVAGWAGIDPAILQNTRARLGLDGNWVERYWGHLSGLATGDLGRSITSGFPVWDLFAERIFVSMPQWVASIALLLIVPVPAAMMFCSRHQGFARRALLLAAHTLLVPQFLACCAGQAIFVLFIAPALPPELDLPARRALIVVSATMAPLGITFLAAARTAAECAKQPFALAYLALGATEWQLRTRLFVNVAVAMKPLISRTAFFVVIGSVFSEPLFSIHGVGALFWDSLRTTDTPVMMAFVLLVGLITLVLPSANNKEP